MSQRRGTGVLVLPVGDRDHIQGPADAPATLVEYGDFAFRNFPLTELHPHAQHAAEVAEAAGAQGKFWEMHDRLFQRQFALDDEHLITYAEELGLDSGRVARELAARTYKGRVRDDFMSGVRSGVNGTPTFFINDVRHDQAWDEEGLAAALERAVAVKA